MPCLEFSIELKIRQAEWRRDPVRETKMKIDTLAEWKGKERKENGFILLSAVLNILKRGWPVVRHYQDRHLSGYVACG